MYLCMFLVCFGKEPAFIQVYLWRCGKTPRYGYGKIKSTARNDEARSEMNWEIWKSHFLPAVYIACSAAKCQRCVKNKETALIQLTTSLPCPIQTVNAGTEITKNVSVRLHSSSERNGQNAYLTPIPEPFFNRCPHFLVSHYETWVVLRWTERGALQDTVCLQKNWPGCLRHSDYTVKYSSSPHSFCCSVYIQENPSHLDSVYCITNDT